MRYTKGMKPICHVCGSESPFLLRKDEYDLYKCSKCELVFVFPQPTPEYLSKELYSYESGYMANRVQDLARDPEQKRVTCAFDYFEKVKKGGRILDVGSGNGQMLYWAKKRGFSGSGVELNRRTAEWAQKNGFETYIGFLESAPYKKHSFDFVFLGEIIEHVNSPREFIQQCAEFLTPNGHIAITTPNLDCAWSKTTFKFYEWFGVPWSSVTPPYHLYQFNPQNLAQLMKERGFELRAEYFLRIPPLKYELGMLHVLKRYKKSKTVFNFLFMIFSYGLYTVTHTFFKLVHPFMKKDFQMIQVYQKI